MSRMRERANCRFSRRAIARGCAGLMLMGVMVSLSGSRATAKPLWEQQIDAQLGMTGDEKPGGVYRIDLNRDLSVSIRGVSTRPAMIAEGFLAFKDEGDSVLGVADLPLVEDELDRVSKTVSNTELEINAIHNHVVLEYPKMIFIHMDGLGKPAHLAHIMREAIDQARDFGWRDVSGGPQTDEVPGLDSKAIEQIIGHEGQAVNGVLEISVDRKEEITDRGLDFPPDMGPQHEFHFQPLPGMDRAIVVAEFVLRAEETAPVIRYLHWHGFSTTALHNHFLFEEPRLFFLHAVAVGDQMNLAHDIRTALNMTNSE